MKETVLLGYLSGAIGLPEFKAELASIRGCDALRMDRNLICDLAGHVEVVPAHLASLCATAIRHQLTADEIQAIAFFLIASEHFQWDNETSEGALVSEVLFDWADPEINYPLTIETLTAFEEAIRDGRHPFR